MTLDELRPTAPCLKCGGMGWAPYPRYAIHKDLQRYFSDGMAIARKDDYECLEWSCLQCGFNHSTVCLDAKERYLG